MLASTAILFPLAFSGGAQVDLVVGESQIDPVAAGLFPGGPGCDVLGVSTRPLGDLDGDGKVEVAVGAPFTDLLTGSVWILSLENDGSLFRSTEITNDSGGLSDVLKRHDHFGYAVSSLGDLDGDGLPELAVGAPGDDGTCGSGSANFQQGSVWILFLNADGTVGSSVRIGGDSPLLGPQLSCDAYFGSVLQGLGDLDDDGALELVVGAREAPLRILSLGSNGALLSVQDASEVFPGLSEAPQALFGAAVDFGGDVDGNGTPDLVVGSPSLAEDAPGTLRLFLRNPDGSSKSTIEISRAQGGFEGALNNGDGFGISARFLGDVDGDGVDDLAVGAHGTDDGESGSGAVWILLMQSNGEVGREIKLGGIPAYGFGSALQAQGSFGHSVTPLDGNRMVVGQSLGGTSGEGAVWVVSFDWNAVSPSATMRSGSGVNLSVLQELEPPRLGATWEAQLACLEPRASALLVTDAPLPAGIVVPGGEILVGGAPLFLFVSPTAASLANYQVPVPDDLCLLGFQAYVQGFCLGIPIAPSNALDLRLGF